MSLAGMDLGPKMDWTLDNGHYQRFKVFKERCIDILSGPLHATPEENLVYYLQCWTGKKVPNLFPNGLQKEKSQMMMKKQLLKRNSELIGDSSKTILSQD